MVPSYFFPLPLTQGALLSFLWGCCLLPTLWDLLQAGSPVHHGRNCQTLSHVLYIPLQVSLSLLGIDFVWGQAGRDSYLGICYFYPPCSPCPALLAPLHTHTHTSPAFLLIFRHTLETRCWFPQEVCGLLPGTCTHVSGIPLAPTFPLHLLTQTCLWAPLEEAVLTTSGRPPSPGVTTVGGDRTMGGGNACPCSFLAFPTPMI